MLIKGLSISPKISLIIFGTIHYIKQKNTKSYNDWRNSEILSDEPSLHINLIPNKENGTLMSLNVECIK